MTYAKSKAALTLNAAVLATHVTLGLAISHFWPDQTVAFVFMLAILGMAERQRIDDRLYDAEQQLAAYKRAFGGEL